MRLPLTACALLLLVPLPLLVPIAATAQTDPSQPSPSQPSPSQPLGSSSPAQGGPGAGGTAVIRPPGGVDPGIDKTPAASDKTTFPTPVVPPPGSPGGVPGVVAK